MTEPQNPLTVGPVRLGEHTTDLARPERALAIGAHPDDVEFGCGATLAKWADAGTEVSVLVCTDGSKGTWDPSVDPTKLAVTREAEQRAAAERLGATGEVVFLGWPDGELDHGLRQRWQVAYWIRRLRPTVVLGHDPWKRYRLHPDHRAAGFLTCDGVVAARDPLFFPEQALPHHRPEAILLFEADEPDHVERVDGYQTAKIEALTRHESQFESTMGGTSGEELEHFARRTDEKLRVAGRAAGCERAEVFKLIDDL